MRSRWMPAFIALGTIGVVMAVAACAGDRGSGVTGGSVPAGGSGSAETTSVTAEPTGVSAPALVKGDVVVKLDAGGYRVGTVIHVTVSNGMDRPVYSEDFKTACSIVTLQRHDSGGWSDITGCALGRPTVTVTVEPGSAERIELDPASFHLAHGSGRPAFGAGTYRVAFTYRLERAVAGDAPLAAYSPEFAIR